MKNFINLKLFKVTLFFLMLFLFTFSHGGTIFAKSEALKGLGEATTKGFGGTADENTGIVTDAGIVADFPTAIGRILGSVLAFVGVFFFILMIYGGFIWMFARGNDQEVTKAKNIIESAIIGLIVVLSAYAITKFIGEAIAG